MEESSFLGCYVGGRGRYEILQRVGEVAYELALTAEIAYVQPVFHVSMLKKFLGDPA